MEGLILLTWELEKVCFPHITGLVLFCGTVEAIDPSTKSSGHWGGALKGFCRYPPPPHPSFDVVWTKTSKIESPKKPFFFVSFSSTICCRQGKWSNIPCFSLARSHFCDGRFWLLTWLDRSFGSSPYNGYILQLHFTDDGSEDPKGHITGW